MYGVVISIFSGLYKNNFDDILTCISMHMKFLVIVRCSKNRYRHESIHETIHESIHDDSGALTTIKKFKRGKTRMPKRLVKKEAILDLGYDYYEEDDFYILRVALEKEQIDEVMELSKSYKEAGRLQWRKRRDR